jgi:hypothetical protein
MPEFGDTEAFVNWSLCTPAQNATEVDPDIASLLINAVMMRAWVPYGEGGIWLSSNTDVYNSVTNVIISATPSKSGLSPEVTIVSFPPLNYFIVSIANSSSFVTGTPYVLEVSANIDWYSSYLDVNFNQAYTFKLYISSFTPAGTSEWTFTIAGDPPPSTPTLSAPVDAETNVYLNKDSLLQMTWEDEDAEDISAYTVWFYDPDVGWIEQTDRSNYSIVSYSMYLSYVLDYATTYQWFVRKTIDEIDYDSDVWTFTTLTLSPPTYSTRLKTPYGGGDPIEVPTGENNQLTVKRLVAIAQNKVFYEDV